MKKKIAYVGMDVHKNSITLALFAEQHKEEEFVKKTGPERKALLGLLKKLSRDYYIRTCYEASRCGYSIYLKLS
jgi:transposase